MRKIISIVLAVSMLFALTTTFAVGVSAAAGEVTLSFELYEVTGDGEVLVTDIKTLEAGDTVKLYQKLSGYNETNAPTKFAQICTYIDYNQSALETTLYTNNMSNTGIDEIPDFYCSDYATTKTYYNIKTAASDLRIKNIFATASNTARFPYAEDGANLGSFTFTVKEGIADVEELTFSYARDVEYTGAHILKAKVFTGVSDNQLRAQANNIAVPAIESLTITEAAEAPALGADVALKDKTDAGYVYSVTLNNTTEGASYKAYAKDAAYGWTLVKAFGTETTFDIVVENPCDPFQIEVLAEDAEIGTVEAPTYNKTLAELGQISLGDIQVGATNLNETALIKGDVIVPEGKTAAYTVYFSDSYETVTGQVAANGSFTATAHATRAGTYVADITVAVVGEEDYNVATKRVNYTIVDVAAAEKAYFDGTALGLSGNKAGEEITLTIPGIVNGDGTTTISRAIGEFGDAKYSTSTDALVFAKPGVYNVYTDIKDANGAIVDSVYRRIRIMRAENNVDITAVTGLDAAATVDTTYTATIEAVNATEYLFVRREADKYVVVQNWSADNTWDWTPARNGIYEIYCYARAEGAGAFEVLEIVKVNVGNVSATEPTFAITGGVAGATSTIAVTNPVEGLEYSFEIYDNYSNKNIKSVYSTATSFDFVVDKARTYTINVYAKSVGNNGAYDAVGTGTYTFKW
ncbi:MAG: hypothetical protein E7480_05365 [Ruminococcaceae bacterium]|nr:hypothetical protein [Oscillospiraceae bacterium]